jgi:transposase
MKNCYEETSEIHVIPQRFVVRLNRSYKYSCTNCSNITTAKVPLKLRPGAEHTMEMAVETIIAKFEDHMPLERQRKQMHREGLNISVKTLYGLTQHVYDLLSKDLIFLIRKDIFSNRWVHIDESPMPFYNPKKSSGYVFSISNKNASLFIFEPNRNQQIIAEILQGYQGVVVTDGLNIYNNIDKVPGIVHALCWAHVRRKFIEALQFNPMAQEMIDMIGQLYEVERNAKTMNELESLRAERSKKILYQINDWIYQVDGGYLENSAFGKAMKYYKLRKDKLSLFITNKNVPIDNNQAERQQRCPVMGRKNFLHFKSITGADTGTFFYSVVESCKVNKLNPREYLLEMGRLKLQNKTLLSPYEYAKNLRQENKSLSSVKKIDDLVMVS